MVLSAGYSACPLPRMAPAGISYRLQSGSKSRIQRIRTPALSMTAGSGVKSPEKKFRNRTIVKIGTELHTVDSRRQNQRIFRHRFLCPAA